MAGQDLVSHRIYRVLQGSEVHERCVRCIGSKFTSRLQESCIPRHDRISQVSTHTNHGLNSVRGARNGNGPETQR